MSGGRRAAGAWFGAWAAAGVLRGFAAAAARAGGARRLAGCTESAAGCGQRQREGGGQRPCSAGRWVPCCRSCRSSAKRIKNEACKNETCPQQRPAEPRRQADTARHFLPGAARCGRVGVGRMWVWAPCWQLRPAKEN